jgi:hypothetical protein
MPTALLINRFIHVERGSDAAYGLGSRTTKAETQKWQTWINEVRCAPGASMKVELEL